MVNRLTKDCVGTTAVGRTERAVSKRKIVTVEEIQKEKKNSVFSRRGCRVNRVTDNRQRGLLGFGKHF